MQCELSICLYVPLKSYTLIGLLVLGVTKGPLSRLVNSLLIALKLGLLVGINMGPLIRPESNLSFL